MREQRKDIFYETTGVLMEDDERVAWYFIYKCVFHKFDFSFIVREIKYFLDQAVFVH